MKYFLLFLTLCLVAGCGKTAEKTADQMFVEHLYDTEEVSFFSISEPAGGPVWTVSMHRGTELDFEKEIWPTKVMIWAGALA